MSIIQENSQEEVTQRSFKNCEAFCNRLRRDHPQTYQQLVSMMKDYQKNKLPIQHYHGEMKKLFSDQPNVIENVNKLFSPDARIKSNDPIQQLEQVFKLDKNRLSILENTKQLIKEGQLNQELQFDLIQIKFKDDPEALKEIQNMFKTKKQSQRIQIDWEEYNKKPNKRIKPENSTILEDLTSCQTYYASYFYIHAYSLQVSREIKNEIILLDKLRLKIFSHFKEDEFNAFFNEFISVIHLYTECIITQYEFMDIISQHQWIDQDIIDDLRMTIFTRAPARRQITTLFKPLKDTDFKNAEHITGSYVRMHPGYANIIQSDPTIPDVFNHLWVSVPFGSEDYSFSIMRKNSFEEQLFKIEDEMFEYDVNINCYKRTIKLLDQLISGNSIWTVEQLIRKILQIKCLQSVYKTNSKDQEEVITLWQKNPKHCSLIIRERIYLKCQELIKSREIANNQNWKVIQKNNFSRSLDHRSFYFKKNEKQYTCVTRFIKEPDERLQQLINNGYQIQTEYLNSLAQLTTVKPLSSGIYLDTTTLDKNNTIFSLYIPNKQILQETFEIFKFYIETSNFNHEQSWLLSFLQKISEGYFQVELKDQNYNFQTLRNDFAFVEQYITNSSVSYLDTFNVEQEIQKKGNGPSSINRKDTDSSEESDFGLQRIRSLNSPMIDEEEMFPQNQIQINDMNTYNFKPFGKVIYGTQGLYLFIRYFYSLYQRMELAQKISEIFEQNERYEQLNQNEKIQIIDTRYKLFKLALLYQIKNKEFKYQDYISLLFGKQAFLFYTLDKMLSDSCKQLASTLNDKLTDQFLDFLFIIKDDKYILNPTRTEEVQLNNLSYALLDLQWEKSERQLFRFCLQDTCMHINYIPIWSQVQDKHQLNRIQQFIKQYTTTYSNRIKGVFLSRNIRQDRSFTNNQTEWLVLEQLKIKNDLSDFLTKY